MKKQFFAACFVLLSAACASEQTTESTAIILDEHNMTDLVGNGFRFIGPSSEMGFHPTGTE